MIIFKKPYSKTFNALRIYILIILSFLLMGCEGFKFQGTMCDSMQPGQVSTECHAYSEEEALKAIEHKVDDKGECLKCKKAEKIQIKK